jgi:hypothetical protein
LTGRPLRPKKIVTLELRQSSLMWLDGLHEEWGLRSRGALVSRLLDDLATPSSDA